jgi:hypothetical protein
MPTKYENIVAFRNKETDKKLEAKLRTLKTINSSISNKLANVVNFYTVA